MAGVNLTVCRNTFLNVLQITMHRVIGVFKRFKMGANLVPVETRGGDHKQKKYGPKRQSVIDFISSFKANESHYGRNNSTKVYLPSELNVKKMWRMYLLGHNEDMHVTLSLFRRVFCTNFNISFATPAVDECSTCLSLQHKISIEQNDENKDDLKLKLQCHKREAKCFFEHLKQNPDDCYLLSFDCQKNLVLPKLSDQSAYYSRQFYCYNLSVVKGVSSESLKPENVSIYSWSEDEAKKSSNEVASTVFNELVNSDLTNYTSIRLVADGCAGQNKNINVLCMCMSWMISKSPSQIKTVEIVYPVTGHSFLPSDRVFGLIERDIKKKKTIIQKEEYHALFRKHGKLKIIGNDWVVYDWKKQAASHMKTAAQLHFRISQCKRIVIRKTKMGNLTVRGEVSYNSNAAAERIIFKLNHRPHDINPDEIPIGVRIKKEKCSDVNQLLIKHFGDNWKSLPDLQWYKRVIEEQTDIDNEMDEPQDECDCMGAHQPDHDEVILMNLN